MTISDLHYLDQFVFLDYLHFFKSYYFDFIVAQNLEDYFWSTFYKNINNIDYDRKYHTEFSERYKEWEILKVEQILNKL
jgi:hypothetical protein